MATNPQSQEPLRSAALDLLATAVMVLDADLRILQANTAAQSLLHSSAHRLYGTELADIVPGADELVAAARRALLEERQFSERSVDLRLQRDMATTIDCTITPVWRDATAPVELILEMTALERHQRIQFEGNLALQNQASSELLKGLAHEIKNPLGGIRGAAQLLEGELEDARLTEYTQVIIGETDRLRSLVDRMLGPREIAYTEDLNVHDVLEHVRLVVEAERHGRAPIERDYDPSLPLIHADRDQLVQAFLNLVSNAARAVDQNDGTITLRTRIQRKFTIGSTVHRMVVRVEIIDTGCGVDPELGASIFFPLISGHADGSGLGLPIAQSLINRQGGLIAYDSEPGHTVFSVWLPLGENA